jgi:hypothetical protein
MKRYFTNLGAKNKALDSDPIANIAMLLEDFVVGILVLAGTNFVAADVQLKATAGVLKFGKGCFAHDSSAHQTTRKGHLLPSSRIFIAEIA